MTIDTENTLRKPEVYETKQIQLTSPILHIGSAVSQLSPFEYVQTGKFVYLPDQDALAKALKERGYLNDYIQRIESRQEIVTLLEDAFGDNWYLAKNKDGQFIFPKERRSLKWTEQKITDLRPMIRNGFGQLYIPGSSIKGAIRTAIAYHLLKHGDRYKVPQQQRVSEIENRLRNSMGELRNRAKFADDKMFMDRLFSFFRFEGDRSDAKPSPNTDFMRSIHVTDSKALIEENRQTKQGKKLFVNLPVTTEVIIISHFDDWRAKYKAPIYTEMVRNVETQFSITIDSALLSKFRSEMQIPFGTINQLLQICQEFADDQWQHERKHWQEKMRSNPNGRDQNGQSINLAIDSIQEDFYRNESCPYFSRLGWASGMLGTTVNLHFSEEMRTEIRENFCPQKAGKFEAPKSRRIVANLDRELKFVPGWVKFKVL
ncbi:type III-A CRISPR-associated RAMP protein Csm5 [[Phormidium ambiguum] IAM M-71]|uniref:CRISPR system Cms protein Csm5 n=1 Tax=[Phormidium ambiguum] IAM M-71 TaxID=454136 RepID=A0A1U7IF78_9CYAN|nr:type III-A CRISPR-associated RAMP protein Csm5 [Phormidium ambiguum]OKH35675.1 type III-A CRISPR-associated RAMP protein Csm5 [Phormidium ambiguum IAM M-71]